MSATLLTLWKIGFLLLAASMFALLASGSVHAEATHSGTWSTESGDFFIYQNGLSETQTIMVTACMKIGGAVSLVRVPTGAGELLFSLFENGTCQSHTREIASGSSLKVRRDSLAPAKGTYAISVQLPVNPDGTAPRIPR